MAMAMAVIAVLTDQVSKWAMLTHILTPADIVQITPFFNLRLGFNTGVSFGMFKDFFEDWPGVLTAFKLVVASGLILWALRTTVASERVGLSLIAGGALGNALDRHREGAVTDFLDLHWAGWHWPTFNLADVAITGGAGLLILAGLFARPSTQARGDA